jgi:nitrite reductase (NADH) small subunit
VDETAGEHRPSWVDVGDVAEVVKRKKFVVGEGPDAKVIIVHDNCVYALDNVCIHKQRELVKGVVLGDRIVCPGHQWAFQLSTGFEAKMERHQPTYPVRVTDDGRVELDVASPSCARPVDSETADSGLV